MTHLILPCGGLEIGDWRLEIGDWRLEIAANTHRPKETVLGLLFAKKPFIWKSRHTEKVAQQVKPHRPKETVLDMG